MRRKRENKIFIGVDLQYGFVEGGGLPVQGGMKAALNAAKHLEKGKYDAVFLTRDWHPSNHCSFVENGGTWPIHCVQGTKDAEIVEEVLKASPEAQVLNKGTKDNLEEYSAFGANKENLAKLTSVLSSDENVINHVTLCGIAGDVCVLNTLKDLLDILPLNSTIIIPIDSVASLDEHHHTLIDFCQTHNAQLGNEKKIEIFYY